jgi:hypothetical protein
VTRPTWLLGTNAYLEVADNDLLDFGASDSFTVLAAVRQWATPASSGRIVAKGATSYFRLNNTSATTTPDVAVSDGTNVAITSTPTGPLIGGLGVYSFVIDRSAQRLTTYVNGAAGTHAGISTLGAVSNTSVMRIGSTPGGSALLDAEVYAVAIWRRALSAAEIAALYEALQIALPEPPNTTTLVNETTDRTVALVGGDRNLTLHTLPKGLVLDS